MPPKKRVIVKEEAISSPRSTSITNGNDTPNAKSASGDQSRSKGKGKGKAMIQDESRRVRVKVEENDTSDAGSSPFEGYVGVSSSREDLPGHDVVLENDRDEGDEDEDEDSDQDPLAMTPLPRKRTASARTAQVSSRQKDGRSGRSNTGSTGRSSPAPRSDISNTTAIRGAPSSASTSGNQPQRHDLSSSPFVTVPSTSSPSSTRTRTSTRRRPTTGAAGQRTMISSSPLAGLTSVLGDTPQPQPHPTSRLRSGKRSKGSTEKEARILKMGLDLVVPSDEEEWEDWVERRAREKRKAREAMALAAAADSGGTAADEGRSTVRTEAEEEGEIPIAESSKMAQMRMRNASATNGSPRSRRVDPSAKIMQPDGIVSDPS